MNEIKIQEIINTPRMEGHDDQEGNFSRGLYKLIQENFQPDFEVIEIGTYEGVTAILFALTCRKVITVDPFDAGYNFDQESKEDLIRAEKMALERFRSYTNIKVIKKTSKDFYQTFRRMVDAVYIDADHTFEGIEYDLEHWKNKIKPGGFIAGHDAGSPTVSQAIDEILGGYDKVYDDGSWIKLLD